MDPIKDALIWLDPVLVAPYRWLDDPVWSWWLGTLVLAGWACLLGELTMALAMKVNRKHLDQLNQNMVDHQRQSMNALRAGDKKAYKLLNKEANEFYGKSFFLYLAMGCSTLWPAFLAAAWLQMRFSQTPILVPVAGWSLNFVAGFLIIYIGLRFGISRLKKIARPAANEAPSPPWRRHSPQNGHAGGPNQGDSGQDNGS